MLNEKEHLNKISKKLTKEEFDVSLINKIDGSFTAKIGTHRVNEFSEIVTNMFDSEIELIINFIDGNHCEILFEFYTIS